MKSNLALFRALDLPAGGRVQPRKKGRKVTPSTVWPCGKESVSPVFNSLHFAKHGTKKKTLITPAVDTA